ncbi:MAG: hypothetical protein Q4Q53_09045, partial [Methanocorpusculum sp.]|nr:hypothetical protein [Methanocorpusculum sp.]
KNSIEMSRRVSLDTWDNFSYSVAKRMETARINDKSASSIKADEFIVEKSVDRLSAAAEPAVQPKEAIRTRESVDITTAAHKPRRSMADIARRVKSSVINFAESHPKTIEGLKFFGVVAITAIAEIASNSNSPSTSPDQRHCTRAYDNDNDYVFRDTDEPAGQNDEAIEMARVEGNHTPKAAHETSSYTRIRNGKEEKVRGYKTGSKRDE